MSSSRTISSERPKKILNLSQYIYLSEVRAQTGLINGEIVYNGNVYTKAYYDTIFPIPSLVYEDRQLDSRIVKK